MSTMSTMSPNFPSETVKLGYTYFLHLNDPEGCSRSLVTSKLNSQHITFYSVVIVSLSCTVSKILTVVSRTRLPVTLTAFILILMLLFAYSATRLFSHKRVTQETQLSRQIACKLCTQYVDGIYSNSITLKTGFGVVQGH